MLVILITIIAQIHRSTFKLVHMNKKFESSVFVSVKCSAPVSPERN